MRNCCSTFYFYAILFSIFGSLTNWTLHAQKFVDKVESRHNDYLNIKNSNYSGRTHHLESVDPSRSGLVEWSRTCKYVWGLKPRGQRRGRGLSEEEILSLHQTCDSWAELESTLAQYKLSDSHIDDGIHWYAEQMIWAIRKLWLFVKSRKRATVCETGFGAGHASLLFLSVPGVSVHSFDILANKHQAVAADVVLDMVNSSYNIKTEKQGVILEENLITNIDATLAEVLEPRLFIHPGDTKRSLPQFVARAKSKNITCDLVFITVPEREWSDLLQLRVISQSWTWVMQGAFVGETEDYMNIWSKANSQGYICASQCFPAIKKREHKAVQVHGQKISGPFFCVAHYCSNNGVLHADRSHS